MRHEQTRCRQVQSLQRRQPAARAEFTLRPRSARNIGHDISGLRSKSWEEFARPGAPQLDFVFTVCDNAANEVCPVWPGQPMTAHWGVPDPSRAEGTEAERRLAFADTQRMLNQRISIFMSLPFRSLDKLSLQNRLDDIGRTQADVRRID